MTQFNRLRSWEHVQTTERVTKVAVSTSDDKWFLLRNLRHETLVWGHFAIPYLQMLYNLDRKK